MLKVPPPDTSDWPRCRHRYVALDNSIICTELNSSSTSVYEYTEDEETGEISCNSAGSKGWLLFCAIERIRELEDKLNLPIEQRTVGPHLNPAEEEYE